MKTISKQYIIKIPSEISIYYCKKKKILLIKGKIGQKLLKLKTKITLLKKKNLIIVTEKLSDIKLSNKLKKTFKILKNTEIALIKQAFLEVSINTCKKLKLVGVGYKVFEAQTVNNNYKLIHFKLGYSHSIYFKIPKNIKIQIYQSTKIFISGSNYNEVLKIAALIKKCKIPEPYKGKGILYNNEIIKLKEGKKV